MLCQSASMRLGLCRRLQRVPAAIGEVKQCCKSQWRAHFFRKYFCPVSVPLLRRRRPENWRTGTTSSACGCDAVRNNTTVPCVARGERVCVLDPEGGGALTSTCQATMCSTPMKPVTPTRPVNTPPTIAAYTRLQRVAV